MGPGYWRAPNGGAGAPNLGGGAHLTAWDFVSFNTRLKHSAQGTPGGPEWVEGPLGPPEEAEGEERAEGCCCCSAPGGPPEGPPSGGG